MSLLLRRCPICWTLLLMLSLSSYGAQLLVSPDGSSPYQTITEALNAASFGDTVYVEPGIYEEGITLRNGVQLIGSGAGTTIVRFGYGFEPLVRANHISSGRVEGFTFERTEMTLEAPTLLLENSSIDIVGCHVEGGRGSGIALRSSTSHVRFEQVSIYANFGHGLWIEDGARATLVDCLIRNNTGSGILVQEGASVIADKVSIERNDAHGLSLEDQAAAQLTGCVITGQPGWGADLRDSAALEASGCAFADNRRGGVHLQSESAADLESCMLSGGGVGILLIGNGTLTLRASQIRAVTGEGLSVLGTARVQLESCAIAECTSNGLVLAAAEEHAIVSCDVVLNGGTGVDVQFGTVSIADSIIAYNRADGIRVAADATARLDHNNVWANAGEDYVGVLRRPTDISAPPDYANLRSGDLRLRPESACIGAGTSWKTLGSAGDPAHSAPWSIDGAATVLTLGPFSVDARIRTSGSPVDLETIELSGSLDTPSLAARASASLFGSWGQRTTTRGRLRLVETTSASTELVTALEWSAVLGGPESRLAPSIVVDLEMESFQASLLLTRTWPSSRWIGQADVSLGSRTRINLSARVADLSPELLSAHITHSNGEASSTFLAEAGVSVGTDQQASAALRWSTPTRAISLSGMASLERLGDIQVSADVGQAQGASSVELEARFVQFAFEDIRLQATVSFERTSLQAGLVLGSATPPKLSVSLDVNLSRLLGPSANEGPIAAFGSDPLPAQAGEPVTFDASASADPDGEIVDYWWDFGDGEVALGSIATHTFAEPGVYEILLSVVDDAGATVSLVRPLTVLPRDTAPVASFIWEPVTELGTRLTRPLRVGDWIRLDASDSLDPIEGGLVYQWDLESDGLFDLATDDPIHILEGLPKGSHPITLRVVSADGRSHAVLRAVLVAERTPPMADFTHSPPVAAVLDPIRFIDRSTDADGTIAAWEWDFGDGSQSRLAEPTHTFTSPGSFDVTLTVTDDDGLSDSTLRPIDITQIPDVVTVSDVWVLAVGVSDYQSVPDLEFARQDALAFASWALESGVPTERLRLLTDEQGIEQASPATDARLATLVNVRESLGWLRRSVSEDDLVLIFFSGHGYQGIDDGADERDGVDEFFVLLDTVAGSVDDTALRDDEFGRFLDRLPSGHVLVLFDGCHSGGLSRSLPSGHRPTSDTLDLFRDFALQGRLILSAASEAQDAFESPALGHGVFTHFVLEGLGGKADLNRDTQITAWELYEYVLAEVPPFVQSERGAEQIPQIHGEGDVRVIVSALPPVLSLDLSFEPVLPYVGGTIEFVDETIGDVIARLWSFGDGFYSTRTTPVHVYEQSGSLTVTLAVRDSAGAVHQLTTPIEVSPAGRVEAVGDLVVISLGSAHGVAIGDRFEILRDDSEPIGEIEIVEVSTEREAAGRIVRSVEPPLIGDRVRGTEPTP